MEDLNTSDKQGGGPHNIRISNLSNLFMQLFLRTDNDSDISDFQTLLTLGLGTEQSDAT